MKWEMPATAVTSMVITEQVWQPTLASVGSVKAVNGVTVSTDLPGIVEAIMFESGQQVKQGDPLVKLDTRQEAAQLNSTEARLQLAKLNLDRQKGLLEKRVASQSDFDSAMAEFKQAGAAVAEMKATIERKVIRAPFTGVLGIRAVNLGQYLQSGDAVVPLQSLDPIYVNFSLPQQNLKNIAAGRDVRVRSDAVAGGDFIGKITSVDSVINESTRNILVQATLANTDHELRPGMFVNVDVMMPAKEKVLAVPATAINYAPYGDSVFVVEKIKGKDGKTYDGVRQQVVELGPSRGDQVSVLKGLKSGDEIVTSGGFKLAPNAAIERSNEIQPENSAAPTPADS
ncbi:MAG: efflux RND transporter periplasmic adaptor subunit [Chthoniobacterales bacterium]